MAFMREPLYILMQDGYVDMTTADGARKMSFSQELFDEIVIMRYYNMTETERREAIQRTLKTQFETGADGIRKASGKSTVMERAKAELEEWQREEWRWAD